jgi:gliding motility-associated-like protein
VSIPAGTTVYTINGTDNNGCKGKNTVTVTVPRPFAMQALRNMGVCTGESVQLAASGAHSYEWINTIAGLSHTTIANPVALPAATTTYTVAGFDQYRCYSDTERVIVTVHPLPVVNAGTDRQVIYGSPNQLTTVTSNNVTRWNWSPAEFLSCTNCASPVSKPYTDIAYIVTVHTANNCMARDTIKLAVACGEGNIYIPNAFTPDNDGKNDGFTINGYGVRMIRYMRIYNRWGEMVFERRNFLPNDASAAWRGKYKGMDAPAGAYVYLAELECTGGEKFMRKGTVTLIR